MAEDDRVSAHPAWSVRATEWTLRGYSTARPARAADRGTAVLLLPAEPEPATRVRAAYRLAGYRTSEIGADPADEDAWRAVFDAPVTALAYATFFGCSPKGSRDGLRACIEAVAHAQRRPMTVTVLATHSVDVTGAEHLDPAVAALHGLVEWAGREHPDLRISVIDAEPAVSPDVLAGRLADGSEPVVALRGTSVWTPASRTLHLPSPTSPPPLRRHGVYLITGGPGRIGPAVARSLAATGMQPRIVLLDTSAAPSGAEALHVRADVTDPVSLRRALDTVTGRSGPVHGVVHLADGDGTDVLALDEVFRDQSPLDFVALCSTAAAQTGPWEAALAFRDAYARQHSRGPTRTASVLLPVQPEETESGADPAEYRRVLSAAADWALDEHRWGSRPVVPPSLLVELVVVAARSRAIVPQDRGVELRDVAQLSGVDGRRPVEVGVSFLGTGDDCRFRVRSRRADGSGPWIWNVSGRVGAAPDRGEPVDVDRLRRTARRAGPPPVGDGWLTLGPRWDFGGTMSATPDGSLLSLSLPAAFHRDLAAHPLHPGLFDRALTPRQERAGDRQGPVVPFVHGRVSVHAPLPADILVHLRPAGTTGDVDARDADIYHPRTGELLVQVRSYTDRRVSPAEYDRRTSAPPASGPARPDPDDAVAALWTVLTGPYPPAIALVPAGDSPTPAGAVPAVPPSVTAPAGGDDLEDLLLDWWGQALGVSGIGPSDDFFDLGGDSLTAVRVAARLRETFGADLGIGILFEASTVGRLAERLRAHDRKEIR
ncbi:phosphopantetheine-binding protein [Plantactinospora sp. CA-290183]|uniref:phosphopantetheine-binding protein n=1 Tax=Plantactinospora sp. CA-290183 TaxID=3240006 RepID=UPI003D8B65D3